MEVLPELEPPFKTITGCHWYGPCATSDTEADLESGFRLACGRDSAVNAGLRALGVRAAAAGFRLGEATVMGHVARVLC